MFFPFLQIPVGLRIGVRGPVFAHVVVDRTEIHDHVVRQIQTRRRTFRLFLPVGVSPDHDIREILRRGFRQFLHEQENRGAVRLVFLDGGLTFFAMAELAGKIVSRHGKNVAVRSLADMFIKILLEFRPQVRIAETQLQHDALAGFVQGEIFRMLLEISFLLESPDPRFSRHIGDIIEKRMRGRARPPDIIDTDFDVQFFILFHPRQREKTDLAVHAAPVKEIMSLRAGEKPVRTHGAVRKFETLPTADLRKLEILQVGNFSAAAGITPDISAVIGQEIMHGMMDPRFPAARKQQFFPLGPDRKFTRLQFRIQFPQNNLLRVSRPGSGYREFRAGRLFQVDLQFLRGVFQIVGCFGRQNDPVSSLSVFGQLQIGKNLKAQ